MSITITFSASQPTVVLAWGGHIATRLDWGIGNSAVAISGSPFHTRLIGLDGSGGNQDRALSSDAVTFPASITITKVANLNADTGRLTRSFSAPKPLGGPRFSLRAYQSLARTRSGVRSPGVGSSSERRRRSCACALMRLANQPARAR